MKLKERKFKDEHKRTEMLNLRRSGWTYEAIAIIYGVDHSSIYFWCKREHIPVPIVPMSFQDIVPTIVTSFIPEGKHEKTYQDYLEDERRRKYPKLYRTMSSV